jgi:hypothetical protein
MCATFRKNGQLTIGTSVPLTETNHNPTAMRPNVAKYARAWRDVQRLAEIHSLFKELQAHKQEE